MNTDFGHKLIVALIAILGSAAIYTFRDISQRIEAIHSSVELIDRSLIQVNASTSYLHRDMSRVETKVKEHIQWSRATLKAKRNNAHSR